jgi:hypothetical protein
MSADNNGYEDLLVYGIKYTHDELNDKLMNLYDDDLDAVSEYETKLQLDYGIDTWPDGDNYVIVGHLKYDILKDLIHRTDALGDLIPEINWHYVRGLHVDAIIQRTLDNINEIERLKCRMPSA